MIRAHKYKKMYKYKFVCTHKTNTRMERERHPKVVLFVTCIVRVRVYMCVGVYNSRQVYDRGRKIAQN